MLTSNFKHQTSDILQSFFFLWLGAFDLPVLREGYRTFFRFLNEISLLLTEFAANVGISILGAVNLKIKITGIAGLVHFHATEFDVLALMVGFKSGEHNKCYHQEIAY